MIDYKTLKIEDKILFIKGNNSNSNYEGEIVTIITKPSSTSCLCESDKGINFSLYFRGPADEFTLADRESRIKYNENKIKNLNKQIAELNKDTEHLKKYETEEDFVADKLESILSAHSKAGNKASRVSAIKDVLTTLKGSHLL